MPYLGVLSEASTPGSRRFLDELARRRGSAAMQRTAGQSQHEMSEHARSANLGLWHVVQGGAVLEMLFQVATPLLKLLKLIKF